MIESIDKPIYPRVSPRDRLSVRLRVARMRLAAWWSRARWYQPPEWLFWLWLAIVGCVWLCAVVALTTLAVKMRQGY